MKKIKVVFSSSIATDSFYLSPINWFLKLYHDNFGLSKKEYIWTEPEVILDLDDLKQNDLVKSIECQKIDILAFSMYAWNRQTVFSISKTIKKISPNTVIVVGGPEVDSHKNKNFSTEHPYIDYTIYGDGEVAFSRLLDKTAGYDSKLINLVDNQGHVYPHEVFLDKTALKKSPYIEYKDEYINFAINLQSKIEKKSKDIAIVPVWETTKGCPYACSFCDWSSGLHNKVRIWGINENSVPNWQKEIKMFFELFDLIPQNNFSIFWTNPNIGLATQDEEIIEFWAKIKEKLGKGPTIRNPQLSKLKKDVTYRILDKMISSGITRDFKFDVQDLNEQVLKNINRPEIPWKDHREYILNLKSKHKHLDDIYIQRRNKYLNRLSFIWGLPGQTLDHLRYNIIEAGKIRCFGHNLPFELLPNSPAFEDEYLEKYQLKCRNIEILGHGKLFKSKIKSTFLIERAVTENYSLSEYDYFKGVVLYNLYSSIYTDYFKPIFGLEYKIFDNSYKIEDIIKRSYCIFLETGVIGLVDISGKHISVFDYFDQNKEEIYDQFEFSKNS
mgnify:CR=1 FL=1